MTVRKIPVPLVITVRDVSPPGHTADKTCLCTACWLEYLAWCERQMRQQAA
jgi:hypothetical protein